MSGRRRFGGHIAGIGTSSGVRLVVGHWHTSPMGPFSDVMVEEPDGHRVLLAPDAEIARFVADTYTFDEVRVEAVQVVEGDTWVVSTPSLWVELVPGRRTVLGHLLRSVPARLSTHPAWCTVTDPVARVLVPGVRTRGSARDGRREYYGATDAREVVTACGRFDGTDLGELRPVDPPCHFGFSSTPRRPSLTSVLTTVVEA